MANRLEGPRSQVELPPMSPDEPLFLVNVVSEGAITPHGLSADATWEGMKSGRTAIENLYYPVYSYPTIGPRGRQVDPQIAATTAGTIKGFDAQALIVDKNILPEKEVLENQGPFIHYAVASAYEALSTVVDANGQPLLIPRINSDGTRDEERGWIINDKLIHPGRMKVMAGCGFGGAHVASQVMDAYRDDDMPDTSHMMKSLIDRAPSAITQAFGIKGGHAARVAACASSGEATLDAINVLTLGLADAVLLVGVEGVLELPVAMGNFDAMNALDKGKDPKSVSRSLHKVRKGFTIAEGAVTFLLTRDAWRRKHGIKNKYNIIGFGEASGAGENTAPNSEAQEVAIGMARRRAERHGPTEGKLLISGHFTGTPLGEVSEVGAAQSQYADMQERTYMFASKRTTGHMLGAAGNLSLFAAGRAIQEGIVPGTPMDGERMEELEGWQVPQETQLEPDLTDSDTYQFGFGDINVAFRTRRVR